jgi:hypothetical protein
VESPLFDKNNSGWVVPDVVQVMGSPGTDGKATSEIPLRSPPIPTSYGTRVMLKVPVAYALV